MADPFIRKLVTNTRSISRLQSAHTMSFSPNLLYTTLTNTANQDLLANTPLFLTWGYALIDSSQNENFDNSITWQPDTSLIFAPEQGYYNANLNVSFYGIPSLVVSQLYINDLIEQSIQQTGLKSNSFSFTFFAEQNDVIQFSIQSDISATILSSISSTNNYAASPILNIVKMT